MPIYEYRCGECGQEHEALQKVSEPPLTECPACGKPALQEAAERGRVPAQGQRLVRDRFQRLGQEAGREKSRRQDRSQDRAKTKTETKSGNEN